MRKATAVADGWRCLSGGGAAPLDAAPPLFDESPLSPGGWSKERVFEAREIVGMLRECGLTEATIAQVIGISRRELPGWERSLVRPPGVERLQDLGRIVGYFLGGALSPRDVGRWLCAPNRHLAGRRPLELLAGRRWPW